MLKSIISKFQSVVTRIIAFVGGVFGIKPEVVQVPAPPEVQQTETEQEGFKKAFSTAKKAVSTAIKAVFKFVADVANFIFDVIIIAVIFASVLGLGLATAYAVNYTLLSMGIIALATTLWETKAVAEIGLLVLALIGVVNITSVIAEVIWYLLLKQIHIFLWSVLFRDTLKSIPTTDTIDVDSASVAKNINLDFFNGVYKEEITVVDSSPTTSPEPFFSVVPTVIEIEQVEEVVDSSPTPTPTRKDELMGQKVSKLKGFIRELNKTLPAPKRISSRGEKVALVSRIIKAEAELVA